VQVNDGWHLHRTAIGQVLAFTLQALAAEAPSQEWHGAREALAVLHGDSEWRNMLWDDLGSHLIVIDLEDVKWLKRPRALEPMSGNARHCHRVKVGNSGQKLLSSSTAVCT
jgi:Ser/Thr protein kinase RdoA (MazF antagonist)